MIVSCSSCASTAQEGGGQTAPPGAAKSRINEDEVDRALERAARAALGEREGTILVMDAQTGRLRAVVNPRVAFEQSFPPGSAIKPFTALASLRAGLIDAETQEFCRTHYRRDRFHIACTHPKSNAPLDLTHALGFSCNYYFATVGERLSAGAFDALLSSFGFGARTGVVGVANESTGALRLRELAPGDVLGEGDHLLVTPVQLAAAYAALVNGGRLYRPQRVGAPAFKPQGRAARINIAAAHRAVLINGMRGAVAYGTAANAGLTNLPDVQIYGKTGTSTSSNGFRTQGWFVGIMDEAHPANISRPESARLLVLVFLRRAHGAEGAEIARPVFEEYLRARRGVAHEETVAVATRNGTGEQIEEDAPLNDGVEAESVTGKGFRVWVTTPANAHADSSSHVSGTMSNVGLEEYVSGVLAAESSVETEIEALKAQAVVSRTFALRNRDRHSQDGFDFCSTTHCQRYVYGEKPNNRATPSRARIERVVAVTRGEVLVDDRGQAIDSYFHAACGGMTANIQSLWGAKDAPGYLRGRRDDYCASMPHHHWTEAIAAEQLLKALRSDPRSDVGSKLTDIVITRRDASGRAEIITLEGERRRRLRGWDFKLIVGRSLGWNVLKSSRFTVRRAGASFVFRGGGFGHGLGLCQEGAHVMAERGLNYKQIVAAYFPGTVITDRKTLPTHDITPKSKRAQNTTHHGPSLMAGSSASPFVQVSLSHVSRRRASQQGRLSLSSDHFRVSYPARTERREVETVLRALEAARSDIERRLTIAQLAFTADKSLDVFIHETTPAFIASTGQPGWAAAASRGARMELQPLALLRRRGVLLTTLRHEYAHFVIELLGRGRTPRWLSEGLAIHVAGEGAMLSGFGGKSKWTRDELERKLERPASAEEMRALYAASYKEVRALIRTEGEKKIWRRVAQSSN